MYNTTFCAICEYSITDPVCRKCYIKETRVLLNDLNVNSRVTKFIINKVKDKFPVENLNSTKCILCNKENVTLCRYCFSVILTRILSELNFTDDLIENFKYSGVPEEISQENEIIF